MTINVDDDALIGLRMLVTVAEPSGSARVSQTACARDC
jgi:hypothetical protein